MISYTHVSEFGGGGRAESMYTRERSSRSTYLYRPTWCQSVWTVSYTITKTLS